MKKVKAYVIKYEPTNAFVLDMPEVGAMSVSLNETNLYSSAENAIESTEYIGFLDDEEISPNDLSVYEVEITLLNKINK